MKRSILFGISGFVLAGILFTLLAFAGEEEQNTGGILYVRVVDVWVSPAKGAITITYPSGQKEVIDLETGNLSTKKHAEYMPNMPQITTVLNKIKSQGYRLVSHSSSMENPALYDTFVFEK